MIMAFAVRMIIQDVESGRVERLLACFADEAYQSLGSVKGKIERPTEDP